MKNIGKRILIWTTAIFIVLFVSAVDSMTLGQILTGLLIIGVFIFVCNKSLDKKDLLTLLLGTKKGKKDCHI